MDCLGDELLSGPAFSQEEDSGRRVLSYEVYESVESPNGGMLSGKSQEDQQERTKNVIQVSGHRGESEKAEHPGKDKNDQLNK